MAVQIAANVTQRDQLRQLTVAGGLQARGPVRGQVDDDPLGAQPTLECRCEAQLVFDHQQSHNT